MAGRKRQASKGERAAKGEQAERGEAAALRQQYDALEAQVRELDSQGRYQEAMELALQQYDLAQALEDALAIFRSYGTVGMCCFHLGMYADAEDVYKDIEAEVLRQRGPEDALYSAMLHERGRLCQVTGRYEEAGQLYEQALEIRRKALGEQHADVADSLQQMAQLLQEAGMYQQAMELYERALALRQQLFGAEAYVVAETKHHLGTLYQALGDYATAAELFEWSFHVKAQAVGERHPLVLDTVLHMAQLAQQVGDMANAEPLLRAVVDGRLAAHGERHPQFAEALGALGALSQELGDYDEALWYYEQAVAVVAGTLGERHLRYARQLEQLANLYITLGDIDKAIGRYATVLEIRRAVLGEEHPDVARALYHVGRVCVYAGEYDEASSFLKRAMRLQERLFPHLHPDMADTLSVAANGCLLSGEYAAADELLRMALGVLEQTVGVGSPKYAENLRGMAGVYAATERPLEALELMRQAAAVDDKLIEQVFSIGSEYQRMAYLGTIQLSTDGLLSLVVGQLAGSAEAVRAAFDLVLRRKALGAEALAVQREAALSGRHPELRELLEELTALRAQLAMRQLEGPGSQPRAAYEQQLREWSRRREELEAQLAAQLPELGLEQRLRAADREAVAQALPPGSALVELCYFMRYNYLAVPARGEAAWEDGSYLAFVLRAGDPDGVVLVDLGPSAPIDKLIAAYRQAITGEAERASRGVRETGSKTRGAASGPGQKLRAALFDPLREALGDARTIILAPDGNLTRLPFEVLPLDHERELERAQAAQDAGALMLLLDGGERYLIDAYEISYVSVGRDVLRFGAALHNPGPPLISADPDFDYGALEQAPPAPHTEGRRRAAPARVSAPGARAVAAVAATAAQQQTGQASHAKAPAGGARRGARQSRDLGADLTFARLPGTREEGEHIASILGVEALVEASVLERTLKSCRSPLILHIATHGFFLPDQPARARRGKKRPAAATNRLVAAGVENPLLRSGLVVTGVNPWLRGQPLAEELEDAILNAEDVSGLDLLDTELVVLSACETGLGEVQVGEGVFGLRRAFMLAGARTLVMSLWKVPDQQTRDLMARFYQEVLAGQSRAAALRSAQLAIKEAYPSPLFWGAFICQGDPGPIRSS